MRLILKRPLIFFDIESTGVDPQKDRIVELAAIKICPDGTQEERCRRFNPLRPIPAEATAVHGISDSDVKDLPPFSRYAKGENGIAAFFAGCDMGGFNIISFDIPLLKAELERAGENLDITDIAVVDAFRIFTTKEPRTLEAALKFYCGRDHLDSHSALGDVKATIDVLASQLERYDDLPPSPAELDKAVRHPDAVDRMGKLKVVEGQVTVTFGKHRNRTLKDLATQEPAYLSWIIDNAVIPDAEQLIRDALDGHFDFPEKKVTPGP